MENGLLLAASVLSICASILAFIPRSHSKRTLMLIWSIAAVFLFADLALLVYYLIGGRFDFSYVYNHTNTGLPVIYKISALWSGQEGSLLLWASVLSVMGFSVLRLKEKNAQKIFGVFGSISVCIFLMCLISKPFLKLPSVPLDGVGLPQALQDPWMAVHPPLVFIAYSAMGVLASLGIATDKNNLAAEKVQKWMRISWVFLGLGIFTGSIWAYRALGWGGYWAWDPIENAALVPWLMLCGFLHRKDRISRARCVLPFVAACFGTFLTRSGILKDQSTHAYTEGNLIVTIVIGALLLTPVCWLIIAWMRGRKDRVAACKSGLQGRSKGELLPFAGILHMYAMLITLGTIAPMIAGTNTLVEYYACISIAFVLSYSILLLIRDKETLKRRNLLMMAISTAIVICVALVTHSTNIVWIILLWACLMPLSLWLADRFSTNNWTFYLRHIGIILLIAGVITSSGLSRESIAFAKADSSSINIAGNDLLITDLTKKDVLIVHTLTGDIIIQCADSVEAGGYISVPFSTKPFIMLFWVGGFAAILSPCMIAVMKKIKRLPPYGNKEYRRDQTKQPTKMCCRTPWS